MFLPADGLTEFAAGSDALKPPLLRRFPPVGFSVTAPSGLASPVDVRSVDARPAFSKIVGFSRAGVKAWLTRLIRASIALVCSSTCACVALGSLKTALAAARPASTSSWSAFIESRVKFANKACRLP